MPGSSVLLGTYIIEVLLTTLWLSGRNILLTSCVTTMWLSTRSPFVWLKCRTRSWLYRRLAWTPTPSSRRCSKRKRMLGIPCIVRSSTTATSILSFVNLLPTLNFSITWHVLYQVLHRYRRPRSMTHCGNLLPSNIWFLDSGSTRRRFILALPRWDALRRYRRCSRRTSKWIMLICRNCAWAMSVHQAFCFLRCIFLFIYLSVYLSIYI